MVEGYSENMGKTRKRTALKQHPVLGHLLIRAKDRKVIAEHVFLLVDAVGSAKWVIVQNRASISLSKLANPKFFLKSKFLN